MCAQLQAKWLLKRKMIIEDAYSPIKYTADPAPIVYNDTVYLFTSHDEDDGENFHMKDWLLYTSTDMVNWQDRGAVASQRFQMVQRR